MKTDEIPKSEGYKVPCPNVCSDCDGTGRRNKDKNQPKPCPNFCECCWEIRCRICNGSGRGCRLGEYAKALYDAERACQKHKRELHYYYTVAQDEDRVKQAQAKIRLCEDERERAHMAFDACERSVNEAG